MPIEFWNDPRYKPNTKLGEIFWHDFLANAKLLHAFHTAQMPRRKNFTTHEEWELAMRKWAKGMPTIYSVFNKIRQDMGELPYSKAFIDKIDEQVEKEYRKTK